jgi:acyl-CoA reductase-like NAD-dependent aldehyde dehydrogenase
MSAAITPVKHDATMWINGQEVGDGLERRSVVSPIDGTSVGSYPIGRREDASAAVAAARAARGTWAATTTFERADALDRIAQILTDRRATIESLLTAEQGKPLSTESVWEVDEAIAHFTGTAEAVRRLEGFMPASADPNKRNLVYRVPRGVAVTIQPWNWPVAIAASHLAPALGGGNTTVMLPAPTTTLVAREFAQCIIDAELPPGVFNFVCGDGAEVGDALTGHQHVDVVAFTGSPVTGRSVATNAAGKATVLELGGNGPITVLEDADIDSAVTGVVGSAFLNAGQACTAAELVLVHEDVYDQFAEAIVKAVADGVVLGEPTQETTTMGPLHNEATAAKMDRHVADALANGARVLHGGAREPGRPTNLYWPATVLADVTASMEVARDETFGPIVPLRKISSEEEALQIIDDSPYGLAAAVYTRDLARGLRFAERVAAGMVNVNEMSIWTELHLPFGGGAGKQSGSGRLQGRYALEETFTELKTIVLHLP